MISVLSSITLISINPKHEIRNLKPAFANATAGYANSKLLCPSEARKSEGGFRISIFGFRIFIMKNSSGANNCKVVLVGGCFDLLHYGHIAFLKEAKKHGDYLIVLLESDENVRRLKGEGRPFHTQKQRKEMLASCRTTAYSSGMGQGKSIGHP